MKQVKILSVIILFFVVIIILSFSKEREAIPLEKNEIATISEVDSIFKAYWYAGKAEIRTYDLQQSRYGEMHGGKAVLIFVTEPFSREKQVKLDNPRNHKDHLPVLKLNFLKKFATGIYPYSMMLSTFFALDDSREVIKATASGQEWCGQVFSQMNRRGDGYEVASYSYFEKEGDTSFKVPSLPTEDGLWSLIRINYKKLPLGKFQILPGLYHTRLEHHPLKAEEAVGSLKEEEEHTIYELWYPKYKRKLTITFSTAFPHEIVQWEETYANKRSPGKALTTKGVLDASKNIDYWNYNAAEYGHLRDSLGLLY